MALLSWRVVPAWALSTARIATQRACAPSGLMTPCPRISSPVPYSQPRAVLGMQAVVAFGKVSWQQCAVVAIAKPGVRRCQATTFHHGAHIGRWPRPTYDTDDDARSRACSLSSQSQSALPERRPYPHMGQDQGREHTEPDAKTKSYLEHTAGALSRHRLGCFDKDLEPPVYG
jgi:hypothetical protein